MKIKFFDKHHNTQKIAKHFSIEKSRVLTLQQVHSNKVVHARDILKNPHKIKSDAIVSDKLGYALGIITADCAPVLLCDAQNKIIGAAHAGWRGAFDDIIQNTVAEMVALGASSENIEAYIGPCIHQDSYEVDRVFYEKFYKQDPRNRKFFAPHNNKFKFDLPAFVEMKLQEVGVKNIEISPFDTYKNLDKFYSHRAFTQKITPEKGRQISCIML